MQFIQAGGVRLDYRDIELNEENIGSYTARQMILRIGRQEITMTPVGTLLIGAKGRAPRDGRASSWSTGRPPARGSKVTVNISDTPEPPTAQAAPKEVTWVWKIATSPPNIRYIELTQESLFQALMEVAGG